MPSERSVPRLLTGWLPSALLLGALTACTTPAKPAPEAPRPVRRTDQDPLFDPDVPRQGQTVLEALWALEKQVRERDAKIEALEKRLHEVTLELRQRDAQRR